MSENIGLLRKFVVQLKASRAHTYASENADHYRGFDVGQLRAAEWLEPLLDSLDAEMHYVALYMCQDDTFRLAALRKKYLGEK